MTRPLALIEGDLALPDAKLLSGLPPPFGLSRRSARAAPQRQPQRVAAAAAQQTIQNTVRHKTPVRKKPLPPGTMFRFFYKVRQPRDYSAHFNAQLAEARHYLEAGETRVCSSRRDYALGAAIFAATGIALAWLLTTSAMRGTEEAARTVTARPVAASLEEPVRQPQPAVEMAQTVARRAASAVVGPVPQAERPAKPKPLSQAAFASEHALSSQHIEPHKAARRPVHDIANRRATRTNAGTPARQSNSQLGETQVDARLASSRSAYPSAQPRGSKRPEWTAHALSANAVPEQAALLNWAAEQRHASAATVPTSTTRAGVPSSTDVGWNTRMIQRRITDNPDAFHADAAQN